MLPNLGKTIRLHIDTEFTDFLNRDLISIGVAADSGDEFYGENSDFLRPWASKWVESNIYPLLDFSKHGMKRLELSARLWSWIDELPCTHVIISYDYFGDYELLWELFQEENHPKMLAHENIFNNMYRDIDEQIKALGGSDNDYQQRVKSCKTKFELYQYDYFLRTKEIQHHALSDAKANREAYSRLVNEMGIRR
jgi:hypothetical protein